MLIATSCVSHEGGGGYNEGSVTFAKVNLAPHHSRHNQSSRHTTAEWNQASQHTPVSTRLGREEFPRAHVCLHNSGFHL